MRGLEGFGRIVVACVAVGSIAPQRAVAQHAAPVRADSSGTAPRSAAPALGEVVRVTTVAGTLVAGPLRETTAQALAVERRAPFLVRELSPLPLRGETVRVPRDSVLRLEVLRAPRWRAQALIGGTVAGAALGALLGAASVHRECEGSGAGAGPCVDRGEGMLIGAGLGGLAGFLVAQIPARRRWTTAPVPIADPA